MLIHVIREKASAEQISEMLKELENYIKIAVDARQGVLAGGGSLHADCEAALLDAGSEQEDIWGADWIPGTQEIRYESLINLRPDQGSLSLVPQDQELRKKIRAITLSLLGGG